ncbi:hypothetical protein GCM10010517_59330 [Streptosporangium fragile]|uniref:Tyr recombinase domain-containing protein n=1 Tax=Streptosporangium fragile TaxID=46186 RepID=A0ABN3W5T6_9ACTN
MTHLGLVQVLARPVFSGVSRTAASGRDSARPYDLRHAAVSLRLKAGIPPTEVAQRAGHGVDVLLRIYPKCIDGQHAHANRQITEALET